MFPVPCFQSLRRGRIVGLFRLFVAAAILTPPDVISQIGLALPTMLLYEVSIFSVRMVEKKRGDLDEEDDEDEDEDDEEEEEEETEEADDPASP